MVTIKRACMHCGTDGQNGDSQSELRPYGPGGRDVCYRCAIGERATTERREQARASIRSALLARGPLILDPDEQVGPRPLLPKGDPS